LNVAFVHDTYICGRASLGPKSTVAWRQVDCITSLKLNVPKPKSGGWIMQHPPEEVAAQREKREKAVHSAKPWKYIAPPEKAEQLRKQQSIT
jgi:hypothetical protein